MNRREALRIYEKALELDGDPRLVWLDAETAGDVELRAEVERLLLAAQSAEQRGFLSRPYKLPSPTQDSQSTTTIAATGSGHCWPRIDRYRVIEPLGEGGFGTVYRAEQLRPVRRVVALKVMRSDRCDSRYIRRFEVEQQTLARLSHPGIAQIYDAGSTADGDPYLAMECVAGETITEYCDQRRLSLEQRVAVMIRVCAAVQHAHQKGVIHRDLKPPNVLVADEDGRPAPKVIDFGIARDADLRVEERSFETQGALLGSPMYMSPEQIDPEAGSDIDTRTDVYSLGVLLYELLSGLTPFPSRRGSLLNVLRQIKDQDPPRPSERVVGGSAEAAAARGCSSAALPRLLAGELDWIVLKAMDKSRERRYDSAAALGADLGRYLADQPVEARPPSRLYRLRKFVRRNRLAFGASTLLALSLLIGLVGTGVGFWRAQLQADRARQTVGLLQDFLASPAPTSLGKDLTVLQLLENFEPRIAALADRPETQSDLLQTYARTYLGLGMYDRARAFAQHDVALNQQLHGDQDRRSLAATSLLGAIELQAGDYSQAAALQGQAFERASDVFGEQDLDTVDYAVGLAEAQSKLGQNASAVELLRYSLAQRTARLGPDHPDSLHALNRLSLALFLHGDHEEAEQLSRQAVASRVAHFGADHPGTLDAMSDLSFILGETGRLRESAAMDRELLQRRLRVLGENHRKTLVSMNNLAWVLEKLAEYEEAEQLYRDAFIAISRNLGDESPEALAVKSNLAMVLYRRGDLAAADSMIREALEQRRRTFGENHPSTLVSTANLIDILGARAQRDPALLDQAIELSRDLIRRSADTRGASHDATLKARNQLSGLMAARGDFAQAEAIARELLPERLALSGADRESTLAVKLNLAIALAGQEKYAEAEELARSVMELRTRDLGPEHPDSRLAADTLAGILARR